MAAAGSTVEGSVRRCGALSMLCPAAGLLGGRSARRARGPASWRRSPSGSAAGVAGSEDSGLKAADCLNDARSTSEAGVAVDVADSPKAGRQAAKERRPGCGTRWDAGVGILTLTVMHQIVAASWFAFAPLHCSKMGWSLAVLGAFGGLGQFARILVPLVAVNVMPLEHLTLPRFLLPTITGVINIIFIDNEYVLYVNIFIVTCVVNKVSYQALALAVWPEDTVSALRLSEASYVIGYCFASLFGGFLYVAGDLRACLVGQVVVLSLGFLLALTVRPACPPLRCRCPRRRRDGDATQEEADPCAAAAPLAAAAPRKKPWAASGECAAAAHASFAVPLDPETPKGQAGQPAVPRMSCHWWTKMLVVCAGVFVANGCYTAEWSLYSVYLTEKFGTSLAGLVVSQFAGDICGSAVLLAGITKKYARCASPMDLPADPDDAAEEDAGGGARPSAQHGGIRTRLLSACSGGSPVAMVVLASLYALSFVGFAAPLEWLAIVAQIVMGTVYVLLVQVCTEYVNAACDGNKRLYQRCATLVDAYFTCSAFVAALASLALYKDWGGDLLIWICAVLVGVFALVALAVFLFFHLVGSAARAASEQ